MKTSLLMPILQSENLDCLSELSLMIFIKPMIHSESLMMYSEDSVMLSEDSVTASQGLWNGEKSLLKGIMYLKCTTSCFFTKNRILPDDILDEKSMLKHPLLSSRRDLNTQRSFQNDKKD